MIKHLFLSLVVFFLSGKVVLADHSQTKNQSEIRAAQPLTENIKRILEEKDYPPFVRGCFAGAARKLKVKAEAMKGVLKKETIKVAEIDDRWFATSKYVWFSAQVELPEGLETVTVLMQKPLSGECF